MSKNFLIGLLGIICLLSSYGAKAEEPSPQDATLLKLVGCIEQQTCGEVHHQKGGYRFEAWFEVDGLRYAVDIVYDPIHVHPSTGEWIRPSRREVSVSRFGTDDPCSGLEIITFAVNLASKKVDIEQAWRVEGCKKTLEFHSWQNESLQLWEGRSRTILSELQSALPRRSR